MTDTSRRTIGLVTALVLMAPGVGAQRAPQIFEQPERGVQAIATPLPTRPTAEQLARVERRIALATALVDQMQPGATAQGLALGGWRQASLESLLALPLRQLERIEQSALAADSLAAAIAAPADPGVLGSPYDDLVYKPITPCRYIDTRNAGGPFAGYRDYDLAVNGAAYGGSAACDVVSLFGIHNEAFGALAMNVTVIGPAAAPGFLSVKPTQAAPVSSLVNWYEVGAQVANQAIVVTDHNEAVAADFTVLASATTHVIVDIFGAFVLPQAGPVQRTIVETAYSLPAQVTQSIATPVCPATYSMTGGGCDVYPLQGMFLVSSHRDLGIDRWVCTVTNTLGFAAPIRAQGFCVRSPGY